SGADRCSTVASLRCSAAVIAIASLEIWLSCGHVALHDAADTQANAGAAHQRVALVIAMAESPFRSCSCPIISRRLHSYRSASISSGAPVFLVHFDERIRQICHV